MRHRFFVVHNPNAGVVARRHFDKVIGLLKDAGASLDIAHTSRHGEGMRAAANGALSARFDAIVAAGGDGTVHDVASGLLGTPTPLGIIPMGTANVFAREVGLSSSPDRIASTLMNGKVSTIPVGEINGQPVLFVVGIGFDAEAVRQFETSGSRKLGQAGFVMPVLHALLSERSRSLKVTTDHGRSEAEWVIVTRARRYAGGFFLSKNAGVTRPKFQVLRFAGRGSIVRLRQLAALASGLIGFDPGVSVEIADWVRVEGDPDTPVQVDGEMLGALPIEIRSHPQSLQLILPLRRSPA
jgi:diacylglycerol kinase (ATP)